MVLAATPEERLFQGPQPSKLAARTRFVSLVLICLLLHVIPIGLIGYYGRGNSDLAPGEQEIPVEMITEPPPPKQPDPPPKSEKADEQKPLELKPATDAPRPTNDEKVERDAKDKASHAPEVKPEPNPADTKPVSEPAPNSEKTTKSVEESAPKLNDVRPDGEPAAAEPQQPDIPQPKTEQAAPEPAKQKPAAQQPTTPAPATPEYSFAPASNTPIAGGNAASTYLTVVYGMWLSHMPRPSSGESREQGEIVFGIDFGGSLVGARILKSSGSRERDAAAMAALRAAAPFPLPPSGSGISLNLHYGK
jgi:protein TonB